jgi:hypothetical protein
MADVRQRHGKLTRGNAFSADSGDAIVEGPVGNEISLEVTGQGACNSDRMKPRYVWINFM